MKKHIQKIIVMVLVIALIASVGVNVYLLIGDDTSSRSYLENPNQIYIMESGILSNNLDYGVGEDIALQYDFDKEEYAQLINQYKINDIAKTGTEFEQVKNLMNEFSRRLYHYSNYDNHIDMNAIALLEYSLDNKKNGINCRSKSQILNEMCLALGIYARKVWIMPYSNYDTECHVVNEIWDTSLNKWIMFDITNNQYWVDDKGMPLSILEIREKGALQEFCTPIIPGESLSDLKKIKEQHMSEFIYIMKNVVYTEYCDTYTTGESEKYYVLMPENIKTDYEYLISEKAVQSSPIKYVKKLH
ncbi:transglutaminase domain-containing protein [Anaerosporobacter sp.]|uniref:transglutaminase domain-containing protein n=1 Tax=Anaerosporobacter sp. TaxID=1872529 RepID=UPI00286F6F00|nr:transglutaminase domain-containing protein [Anaerosporobacter sp.]